MTLTPLSFKRPLHQLKKITTVLLAMMHCTTGYLLPNTNPPMTAGRMSWHQKPNIVLLTISQVSRSRLTDRTHAFSLTALSPSVNPFEISKGAIPILPSAPTRSYEVTVLTRSVPQQSRYPPQPPFPYVDSLPPRQENQELAVQLQRKVSGRVYTPPSLESKVRLGCRGLMKDLVLYVPIRPSGSYLT
jgi:hypothetical protein